eukprot:TRINITY_DN18837_c0_g1_i21.p1 TRINITY_DN18837_c0_g1~~TRINITY_DN18837_c0_g1_i21.p1  ORF type:complete len:229 (-),score=2.80 TRINITY_DN18837_c0_g1_i21:22-708(-)
MEAEGLIMVSNLTTHAPDIPYLFLSTTPLPGYNPPTNPIIDTLIAEMPPTPFPVKIMDFRGHTVEDPWGQLTLPTYWLPYSYHPANIASNYYVQRFLNAIIDSDAADSSYGENITANDNGCSARTPPNTGDIWIQHAWHGCKWTTRSAGIYHGSCASFSCPALYHRLPVTCQWATCKMNECCAPNPVCTGYSCPAFYHPVANPATKICEIGRAVQQECRDRSRMPSSA